jgi:hypothetical protein
LGKRKKRRERKKRVSEFGRKREGETNKERERAIKVAYETGKTLSA